MRCNKVMERLDDHVDGLLPLHESEKIRTHLDGCTECRETALAANAASVSLSTWNDIEPPADCFDKILVRLEALPVEAYDRPAPAAELTLASRLAQFGPARTERARWMATSGLAAAAAVLAAVGMTREDHRPTRRTRTDATAIAVPTTPARWYQGSNFDTGLRYFRNGEMIAQPALPAPQLETLGGLRRW